MEFGDRLAALREERGMSRQDIADKSGLSMETIGRYERNERLPDIYKVQRLANVLEADITFLITGEEVEQKQESGQGEMASEIDGILKRFIRKLAAEDPDVSVYFRNMDKNLDKMSSKDIRTLAAAFGQLSGKTNKYIEGALSAESPHGDF